MKQLMSVVVALSLTAAATVAHAQETESRPDEVEQTKTIPVGVDLFPFVGTSSGLPGARRVFSLNVGGGISGGTDALELSGGVNINTGAVYGAQLAGGANIVVGDVGAGQLAGGVNIVSGDVSGLQMAGGANIDAGALRGAQFAGGVNITGAASGLQIAGGANIAGGDMSGAQLSGGANIAAGDVRGFQLAPFNLAGGQVKGVQLGVVNVAKRSSASIGLVSIVSDGFVDLEVFGSDDGLAMAGIRHGGDHFYNVYYAGTRLLGGAPELAYGLALGGRAMLSPSWEFSADVGATQLIEGGDFNEINNLFKLRPLVGWRANETIAVFGGPTLSLLLTDADHELIDRAMWEFTDASDATRVGMWIGATLGVRLL